MAEEKEKVLYEYQGDVSSLKAATKDAISMLDKYESTVKNLAKSGNFEVGKTAFTGFQRTVNGIIKQVNTLSNFMGKASQENKNALVPNTDAITGAYRNIADALDFLQQSSKVTTDDMKLVTQVLQESRQALDPVAAKAQALGSSFAQVAQVSEQSMSKVSTSAESASQKTSSSVDTIGQQWDNYINRMSKSAEMSAQVFEKAGKFNGFVSGVENVGAKMVLLRSRVDSAVNHMVARIKGIATTFDPLVAKLQGFKDKAVNAGNMVSHAFSTVAAAFRRTSDGTEGASASQRKFSRELNKSTEKLNTQQKELKQTASGYKDAEKAASSAGSAMAIGASMASAAFGAVTSVLKGVADSLFALAGVEVGNMLSDGAKGAIDYVENLNLFEVAMGKSIDKGREFVDQMQEVYGMDPSNIYRYAGNFYQLTDAIGMCDEASATISLSMTKAANDLSSLFNTDIETVVNDLSSGMMGMSRTVKKYGMDIRATTIQQTAYKYGLTENVEEMSEANRQALRYITMLEQAQNALKQTTTDTEGATKATGDFARNIETPANQLKIFKEQMSQLGRAVGNFIVAPLQKALPYINGFVMALRVAVNALATVMGVSVDAGESLSGVGDEASKGLGAIASGADKASKKMKQMIAPFDELNVLQENTGGSDDPLVASDALDPALSSALSNMELQLENISMKANKVRDDILGFLGLAVTTDPITGDQIIQWDKDVLLQNLTEWFTSTPGQIAGVVGAIGLLGGAFTALSAGMGAIGDMPINLTGSLGGLGKAFSFLTNPITLVILALGALLLFSEDFRTAFVGFFTKIGESFVQWGTTLGGVFSQIGTDLATMWDTHIQPTIEAIGTALVPVFDTLGSLWENLSVIVNDALELIGTVWTEIVQPALEAALEIIQDLCEIFQEWWRDYVGPVVEYIGDGIEKLWKDKIKPALDKAIETIGDIIDLIKALWDTVLKPIIDWLGKIFGPAFKAVFKIIWDAVEWAIGLVMDIINSLLEILDGVIDFLTGVFSGDWERAWKGLVNILVGVGNLIIDIFEGVINGVIFLFNSLVELIWQTLQALINVVLGAVEGIAELLGFDLNLTLNAEVPNIPSVNIPRIPEVAAARGGVITGPTRVLAGEAGYSEAFIPLDDSPQMQDLIDKIAEARSDTDNQPIEVRVFIGDKEFDAYTYKASERGKKIVGKQPVKIGG